MRLKIMLLTQRDVLEFCRIAGKVDGEVRIVGHDRGQECSINAKSLLGLLYCTTCSDLWCVAENDISEHIEQFLVL